MKIFSGIMGLINPQFPKNRIVDWYAPHIDEAVIKLGINDDVELERIVTRVRRTEAKYQFVEERTRVPWPLIAALHYRESSLDFRRSMTNGQSWRQGFDSWESAAIDALRQVSPVPGDWTLEKMLHFAETFSGTGYYDRKMMSPYLWALTNKYESGVITTHGFDPAIKQKTAGVLVLLLAIGEEMGIEFDRL
jgi:lysozyme family protein